MVSRNTGSTVPSSARKEASGGWNTDFFSTSSACTLCSSWDVLKLTKKQIAMELTDSMKQATVGRATKQRKIIDLEALRPTNALFSSFELPAESILRVPVGNPLV